MAQAKQIIASIAAVVTAFGVSAAEAAGNKLSAQEAQRQSYNIWPASTLTSRSEADYNGYHFVCENGTNRVVNSNNVKGNGNLGTHIPGRERHCTAVKLGAPKP